MTIQRVPLAIDPEVLAAVDAARGDVSRNLWFRRAIEQRLRDEGFLEHAAEGNVRSLSMKQREHGQEPPKRQAPAPKKAAAASNQRARPSGTWRTL